MSNAAPLVAVPPPVPSKLDDFSDKLSPMLVKELRQGLRARAFVAVFLGLQIVLVMMLLISIGFSEPAQAGQKASDVIFSIFTLAVLIIQPLRGVGAVHQEIKGQTIDLMVLTRLSAWRIILGKWISIVSQSTLLLIAITPYLILRYFFGGMELFAELTFLLLIFLASAALTAIIIGVSAIPSAFMRVLLTVGIIFLMIYSTMGGVIISGFRGSPFGLSTMLSFDDPRKIWALIAWLIGVAYATWLSLALGASMIAPMAENHSTTRRLIALGMMLLIGVIAAAADIEQTVVAVMLLCCCTPIIAISLAEPLQLLPPICRPFLRFGIFGRIAGRFLYPGWPAGVFFTALLIAIGSLVVNLQPNVASGMDPGFLIFLSATVGSLLMPALIIQLLSKKFRISFSGYVLVFVILTCITIMLSLIAGGTENDSFLWWFLWIPSAQIPLWQWVDWHTVGFGRTAELDPLLYFSLSISALYLLLMIFCAVRKFSLIRAVEKDAEKPATTP
jgi:ABC-type transport system involved in multi-copper enzyme maturation permease subunit